jgi:peptide chain release factor 1
MLTEKIDIVKKRYDEIYQMISNPEIIADQKKYIELNKELKELSILVNKGKLYKEAIDQKNEAEDYIKSSDDKDMIEMAKEQLEISKQSIEKLEDEIKILLIPKDPDDAKNVVMEIRAGTGGDEASIFAGDLYRMYTKFAQEKKWNMSIVDTSEGTAGGFKEVIFEIAGEDV